MTMGAASAAVVLTAQPTKLLAGDGPTTTNQGSGNTTNLEYDDWIKWRLRQITAPSQGDLRKEYPNQLGINPIGEDFLPEIVVFPLPGVDVAVLNAIKSEAEKQFNTTVRVILEFNPVATPVAKLGLPNPFGAQPDNLPTICTKLEVSSVEGKVKVVANGFAANHFKTPGVDPGELLDTELAILMGTSSVTLEVAEKKPGENKTLSLKPRHPVERNIKAKSGDISVEMEYLEDLTYKLAFDIDRPRGQPVTKTFQVSYSVSSSEANTTTGGGKLTIHKVIEVSGGVSETTTDTVTGIHTVTTQVTVTPPSIQFANSASISYGYEKQDCSASYKRAKGSSEPWKPVDKTIEQIPWATI